MTRISRSLITSLAAAMLFATSWLIAPGAIAQSLPVNAFYVEWTSVIRGGGDPNNPDIRRRTQRMDFTPGSKANTFNVTGRDNPRTNGLAWAQVQDQTLSVYVMQITDTGGYVIQTYNRTLEGTGMRLKFINVANGEPQREVDARLVKVGK
jgi:hypothetical protein